MLGHAEGAPASSSTAEMSLDLFCTRQNTPEANPILSTLYIGSTDGGGGGIAGIAGAMGELVAAHAVMLLKMADDRFDGGAALEGALDLRGDAAPLAGGIDLEGPWRVVATVAGIGDDAVDGVVNERFHLRQDSGEGVAIPRFKPEGEFRIAGQGLHMGDELAALGVVEGSATLTLTPNS